jgi:hypothetical protein
LIARESDPRLGFQTANYLGHLGPATLCVHH